MGTHTSKRWRTSVLLVAMAGLIAAAVLGVDSGGAGPITIALQLQATEGDQVEVTVPANPGEISITKVAPWRRHKKSVSDSPTLEFLGGQPAVLDIELTLDESASSGDIYALYVADLESLAYIQEDIKRPPMVHLRWGNNFPRFEGVVENVAVRYTLFLPDGTPTRATVNLRMREASKLLIAPGAGAPPSTPRVQ